MPADNADGNICQVLVVDDEPPARMRLRAMLGELEGYNCVGEAGNGDDAIRAVQALHPDVVLMDIRMPGLDGLQAARKISEARQPPALIFCTAYDEHALEAFDASAVGYLLKPIKRGDLENALLKCTRLNRVQLAALQANAGATDAPAQHLLIRTARGEERVALEDVRALVADSKYVSVYTSDRELLLDQSLRSLEAQFPDYLLRVHRNALVAKPHIKALEKLAPAEVGDSGAQYCVVLRETTLRPQVSRRHIAAVRRLLRAGEH